MTARRPMAALSLQLAFRVPPTMVEACARELPSGAGVLITASTA